MSTTEGIVYLVGAGPGDPELITVAGRRLLAQAECIVYDKLVDKRLLSLAPAGAQRIYVGKEAGAGQHTTPQSQINAILVDLARAGKRVVRLKGGIRSSLPAERKRPSLSRKPVLPTPSFQG